MEKLFMSTKCPESSESPEQDQMSQFRARWSVPS